MANHCHINGFCRIFPPVTSIAVSLEWGKWHRTIIKRVLYWNKTGQGDVDVENNDFYDDYNDNVDGDDDDDFDDDG